MITNIQRKINSICSTYEHSNEILASRKWLQFCIYLKRSKTDMLVKYDCNENMYLNLKKQFQVWHSEINDEFAWMVRITLEPPWARMFFWHGLPTSHIHMLCCCWSDDDSLHSLVHVSTWLKLGYSEVLLTLDESSFLLFPWKQIWKKKFNGWYQCYFLTKTVCIISFI